MLPLWSAAATLLLWSAAATLLLILAWKVAGWYGLDRWLLPRLGTPWTRAPAPIAEPHVEPVPTI